VLLGPVVKPWGNMKHPRLGRALVNGDCVLPCRRIARHIQCLKCAECGGVLKHTGQKIYCDSCTKVRDVLSKRMAANKRNERNREMKLLI
jgi:hypothetical protein